MKKFIEFKLPIYKDIYGEDRLEFFDKIGVEAKPTQFAEIQQDKTKQSKTYYIATSEDYSIYCSEIDGYYRNFSSWEQISNTIGLHVNDSTAGIRPKVKYSDIKDIATNIQVDEYGVKRVKCFEFPKTVVNEIKKKEIISYLKSLDKTGKDYYFARGSMENGVILSEFLYEDEKYVFTQRGLTGTVHDIEDRNIIAKVEPLTLLVDEEKNVALFEDIICFGIPNIDQIKLYEFSDYFNVLNNYLYHLSESMLPSNIEKSVPIKLLNINISDEQLKMLLEKRELTLLQKDSPQIKIYVNNDNYDYAKTKTIYKKENN